jgi:hypothetical protein
VDPSGFTDEEPTPLPKAGDHPLTVWVIGDPPPWRKEPKREPNKEEPREPADVGATTVPTDINVWGNTAGHAPQPSPTTSDAPPQAAPRSISPIWPVQTPTTAPPNATFLNPQVYPW